MKAQKEKKDSQWQNTNYSNLVRYKPSKKYFARIRIGGKLIRRSLKTTVLSVAKLRLAHLETDERVKVENQVDTANGRMTVGDAVATYRLRFQGDASLKPRTRDYHEQRITALLKSWPELEAREIRSITKAECLNWAARFANKRKDSDGIIKRSATAFNHTVGILKRIFEVGLEAGVRYDNPVRFIKRVRERSKKPVLPEMNQFDSFVSEIENGGSGQGT